MVKCIELINSAVIALDDEAFENLKTSLITHKYMKFCFLKDGEISRKIIAEKLLDYFEKVELKTGKSFGKVVEHYTFSLNAIVTNKIAKGRKGVPVCRAKKYFDYAQEARKVNGLQGFIDHSRILLCLYMEIINNKGKMIENFNFSSECLDIKKLIGSMKKETTLGKKRFDFDAEYSFDRCTFILTIIMYHYIKNTSNGEDN